MTNEEIRARFVELAPEEFRCSTISNIVDLTFSLDGIHIIGTSPYDQHNATAALALLKWLNIGDSQVRSLMKSEDRCYSLIWTRRVWRVDCVEQLLFDVISSVEHPEPVYAVMSACIHVWESTQDSRREG